MGVFLITDQHDHQLRVVKPFDESGVSAVVSSIGLGAAGGLAVDGDGNVIVADSSYNRLAIWDLWTGSWHAYGASGSGQDQFSRPAAVATGFDGRVYIADSGNNRIVRIDNVAGSGWTAFGASGGPTAADARRASRRCFSRSGASRLEDVEHGLSIAYPDLQHATALVSRDISECACSAPTKRPSGEPTTLRWS